jgi:hypothetical protein
MDMIPPDLPRPLSEKQLAANRANALKSTGPRTEAGKARSSRNAVRHAMLARSVLLRCESAERFRVFVDRAGQHDGRRAVASDAHEPD